MTIVSSGTLALQDAGTNPSGGGGGPTYHIDTTFTAGSHIPAVVNGDFIEYDEQNEEETTVTEALWSGAVYGYNVGGSTGSTGWDAGGQWDVPWDDENAVVPSYDLNGIGSGSTWSYTDLSSTSRTIVTFVLCNGSVANSGAGPAKFVLFALSGTSIPDTDNTFVSVTWGGLTLTRSSADEVFNNYGTTTWLWEITTSQVTSAGASTGTKNLKVRKGTAPSGTLNNGIAEEFGGADSSNVALSDYYRGADDDLVASTASSNIPTSGEIKFSDFYGTENIVIASNIHATAMTSGTSGGYGYVNAGYLRSLQTESVTQGTVSDHTITSFDGGSNFLFMGIIGSTTTSSATTGTISFTVKDSGTAPSNSGFTTLKIWLGQGSGSGSPDLTLSRASANQYTGYTQSGIYGGRSWGWTSQSNPNQSAFHPLTGVNGTNFYMEII